MTTETIKYLNSRFLRAVLKEGLDGVAVVSVLSGHVSLID